LNHVEGTVVVWTTLDEEGKVISAKAISGERSLVSDCIANAKNWRFHSNVHKAAVIIYRFKIKGLCNLPCPSQFRVEPPNFVNITAGNAVGNHLGNSNGHAALNRRFDCVTRC
jgi:hypothetical protein